MRVPMGVETNNGATSAPSLHPNRPLCPQALTRKVHVRSFAFRLSPSEDGEAAGDAGAFNAGDIAADGTAKAFKAPFGEACSTACGGGLAFDGRSLAFGGGLLAFGGGLEAFDPVLLAFGGGLEAFDPVLLPFDFDWAFGGGLSGTFEVAFDDFGILKNGSC